MPRPRLLALAALLALACLAQAKPSQGLARQPTLRFPEHGGPIKLLQLTDVHYGERQATDRPSLELIRGALAAEKPDAVLFTGDMLSGFAFPAHDLAGRLRRSLDASLTTGSWWEEQWRALTEPLREAGVPWAASLGNHDAEGDLGRRAITELDAATGGGLALTQPGPAHLPGGGGYWVDVLAPSNSTAVAARVWALDSGNRGCGRLAYGWGCVPTETVAWVREQAARLPRVPSLAMVHIPPPQFLTAWNRGPANGSRAEPVGCPGVDSGLFEALREAGITLVLSGHDHNSDWCGRLDGVRLCYGRKSGFGSYGPPAGVQRGARVVELRLGEDAAHSTTYIWQQDGSREHQAPAAEPRARQERCNLDESGCDLALGPALCLRLRGARNAAVTLATAAGLLALLGVAAAVTVVVGRRVRQHWRQRRGWRPLGVADKQHPPGALYSV